MREYYKDLGFDQGLHGEGAVVNTICALLFWDVLYETPVPDAFRYVRWTNSLLFRTNLLQNANLTFGSPRSPNQPSPLDFNTDDFYLNRKDIIDEKLDALDTVTDEELTDIVRRRWEENQGLISLVNWDLFKSPEQMLGLLLCFTRKQLAAICGRLLKEHRYTR